MALKELVHQGIDRVVLPNDKENNYTNEFERFVFWLGKHHFYREEITSVIVDVWNKAIQHRDGELGQKVTTDQFERFSNAHLSPKSTQLRTIVPGNTSKTKGEVRMFRTIVTILLSFTAGVIATLVFSSGNRYEYHPHGSSFVVFDKKQGIVHFHDGRMFRAINFASHYTSTYEDFSLPDARSK